MSGNTNTPKCSAKALAKALKVHPIPNLTIADLMIRWACSRSSVQRIRNDYDLTSAGYVGAHPEYSICDVLAVEGIDEPEVKWAFGTDDERELLRALRLTDKDLVQLDPKTIKRSSETHRRRAREAAHARKQGRTDVSETRRSFQLASTWLFDPLEGDLSYLAAIEEERSKRKPKRRKQ